MIYTFKRNTRFTFHDLGLKHLKILCLLPFSVPVSRYSTTKNCLHMERIEKLLTK